MSQPSFTTPILIRGPYRQPRQLLAHQEYGGHASIHDDGVAETLGFPGGLIEGPTHFSQFVPLLATLWGTRWFETGCLSVHFQNPCVQGDSVQAFVELPRLHANEALIRLEKSDGTQVLSGTASVGPGQIETELDRRRARSRTPVAPVLVDRLGVGDRTRPELAHMGFDDDFGPAYPFSLRDKLDVITEPLLWYVPEGAAESPWARPVIPLEMISVLVHRTIDHAFPIRQPSVALFLDQEVRLIAGPLFTDQRYRLEREIVGLGESRRTESVWIRTDVFPEHSDSPAAQVLLHLGVLKDSHPGAGVPS